MECTLRPGKIIDPFVQLDSLKFKFSLRIVFFSVNHLSLLLSLYVFRYDRIVADTGDHYLVRDDSGTSHQQHARFAPVDKLSLLERR
jgi:hypothetical protein